MTKTIRELLAHIDAEELVLPEIQRDFVWTKKSVMKLFDSLYRGMPIGHFLVWKAKKPVKTKAFEGKSSPGNAAEIETFYGYLLDGQQRLTAISRVRERDEEYPLRFNLRAADGESPFAWQSAKNLADPWFVSVADVLGKKLNKIQWIDEIRQRENLDASAADDINEKLTKLQSILDYSVGVTEYATDDYRDATELFIRFNGTGKRLSRNDLAMAELSLAVPGLASGELAQARSRWAAYPFTTSFLVQCLLLIHTDRLNLKEIDTAWGDSSPAAVQKSWASLKKALELLVPFLTGTVRWPRLGALPSINALIPLVYVLSKNGKLGDEDRVLARRWLHLTTLNYMFSASVHSTIDRLIRKIAENPTVKALWQATPASRKKGLRPESFDTSRLGGPEMALYLAYLAASGAKDWEQKEHPLDGTVQGQKASLQVHHFFPRALLRKHGKQDDWINYMGNYTIISASTNLGVSTEEPATYIERLNVSKDELRLQCVPEDPSLWRVLNYGRWPAGSRRTHHCAPEL